MKPKKRPTKRPSPSKQNLLLESVLKYIFAALLIFVPLYPKFPLFTVPGVYVAIRAEDFIIGLLAVVLFIIFIRKPLHFFSTRTSKAILVFWLVGLFSTISAIFLTRTVVPHLALLHWARRIEYTLPFFAGLILARNQDNLKFFLKIIFLVAAAVFLYGLAQIFLNAPVISTQNAEYSRGIALTLQPGVNLSSTFAGHYDLATFLVMTLALLTSLMIIIRAPIYKILSISFLILLFWLQLRTGSRIAFGALIVSLSLILLIARKRSWIIPLAIISFIGLANTPSISGRFTELFNVFQFNSIQQQVKGVMDSHSSIFVPPIYAAEILPSPEATPTPVQNIRAIQQDRSTSIRFDVEWPRAIRALKKNPFLGTGYSSISLATDNDYLRALGETGLLGFLAWVTILISIFTNLFQGLKSKLSTLDRHFIIGTLGMVVGFLIIATFIDVFEASKVATLFWMYTGLASGITKRS